MLYNICARVYITIEPKFIPLCCARGYNICAGFLQMYCHGFAYDPNLGGWLYGYNDLTTF
jgi:hypothetical protein